MEVAFVELVDEGSTESIETGRVEVVVLAEARERFLIGDGAELVVEGCEFLWGLIGDPLVVVETEMMLTFAVDDVADHDEGDLGDSTLTTEGGEVEIDHRPDGAVALPRGEIETTTQSVGQSELFEPVSTPAVALHRGMALVVEPPNVLTQVVLGCVRATDTRRTRRDEPPSTDGFVALEVCSRNSTISRKLAEWRDIAFAEQFRVAVLNRWK
ncbi:hypothetical protein C447_13582 [Halococcus hamelinensis 100A6]|uniref:Uncharacterized protein n=1 Tax=Halococcus hamelinensis 100A6 TaxID=1132509 RepID=M0LXS5_9EURY|nr:hypothetical protein C447_13582 [Halococcus hamelinensis 100A6]